MRVLLVTYFISSCCSEVRNFEDLEKLFNETTAFHIITDAVQTDRKKQNFDQNLSQILVKVESRINEKLGIFKHAATTITKAAEKSLEINQTESSWPVCCTLRRFFDTGVDRDTVLQATYQNPVRVSHWQANASNPLYNSTYTSWISQKRTGCNYFTSHNIQSQGWKLLP